MHIYAYIYIYINYTQAGRALSSLGYAWHPSDCDAKHFHIPTPDISAVSVAVCCSVLQRVAVCDDTKYLLVSIPHVSAVSVAVCCSSLLCVAVCCCVLLSVAVCCNVLHYIEGCRRIVQCVGTPSTSISLFTTSML